MPGALSARRYCSIAKGREPSDRASVQTFVGPCCSASRRGGSRLAGHLVAKSYAGGLERDTVMREALGDQEVGLAETTGLEALSDGTFAMVVTLLVLEIHRPGAAVGHLGKELIQAWPSYLGGLRLCRCGLAQSPLHDRAAAQAGSDPQLAQPVYLGHSGVDRPTSRRACSQPKSSARRSACCSMPGPACSDGSSIPRSRWRYSYSWSVTTRRPVAVCVPATFERPRSI